MCIKIKISIEKYCKSWYINDISCHQTRLVFILEQDRGRKNYDTLESLKNERRRCKPGTDRPGDLSGKRTGRISFLLFILIALPNLWSRTLQLCRGRLVLFLKEKGRKTKWKH